MVIWVAKGGGFKLVGFSPIEILAVQKKAARKYTENRLNQRPKNHQLNRKVDFFWSKRPVKMRIRMYDSLLLDSNLFVNSSTSLGLQRLTTKHYVFFVNLIKNRGKQKECRY